jgi:putative hemolysin
VTFTAPSVAVIVSIVLTVLLLVASGMASGSEIAIFSLTPTDISNLEPDKRESDARIQMLRSDSERTLATILCVNNFVNVTIIMLCNFIFSRIVDFHDNFWLQFIVVTVLLTFLLLLFGEIMPKIYARQNPLAFCRMCSIYVAGARRVVWPITYILLRSGVLAEKVMPQDNPVIGVDDLEQALELTDEETIKDERNILKGIIRFGDETAKDVMTLRRDIVGLDLHNSFDEVLACVVENNYSRIPVSLGSKDSIKGILYIKDLLPYLSKGKSFHWQTLMRPPYFVPETKKIDDLLREFQENKVHMAIVVDEYGGTSGLITLEDILEEIVGEINDEYDDEEKAFTRLNANTYVFEGKTLLSDFCKAMNIEADEFAEIGGDADTLAGVLLELKGDFLALGERIDYRNFTFEVEKMEDRRISEVKVIVHSNRAEE